MKRFPAWLIQLLLLCAALWFLPLVLVLLLVVLIALYWLPVK